MGRITLLPKSAIDKAKALDRQREIEQGKALANRVDTLRELSAVEEKNLKEFRSKSLGTLKDEIIALLQEKNTLLIEIRSRRLELIALMEPIDLKWDDIDKAQKVLDDWEEKLSAKQAEIFETRLELFNEAKGLETKRREIFENEKRTDDALVVALTMQEKARETLADARNEAQTLKSQAELMEIELNQREVLVTSRERDVKIAEETNIAVRTQNGIDKILLEDERGILKAGFEELKRKQNLK